MSAVAGVLWTAQLCAQFDRHRLETIRPDTLVENPFRSRKMSIGHIIDNVKRYTATMDSALIIRYLSIVIVQDALNTDLLRSNENSV